MLATLMALIFSALTVGAIFFHGGPILVAVRRILFRYEGIFDVSALLVALLLWPLLVQAQRAARRFTRFPEERLAPWAGQIPPGELLKLESDLRASRFQLITTAAQIIGGSVLLVGIFFTYKNLVATREGQITDRFIRAVDQLGASGKDGTPAREIRLGGIYGLRRIAQDSKEDYQPIRKILNDYVRLNAPWRGDAKTATDAKRQSTGHVEPPTDIQAALDFLVHPIDKFEETPQFSSTPVNLPNADLRGAGLVDGHLEYAYLDGAHLENAFLHHVHLNGASLSSALLSRAILFGAHLYYARLYGAFLFGARLDGAHLDGAHLEGSHLDGAGLYDAHLDGAYLDGSHLDGAHLEGADLRAAVGLTQDQVGSAHGNRYTKLPPSITRPRSWQ